MGLLGDVFNSADTASIEDAGDWERIFVNETQDDKRVAAALKYFKQDGCCSGSCDCSGRKPE